MKNVSRFGLVFTAIFSCFIFSPPLNSSAQNTNKGRIAIVAGENYKSVIYTVNPDGTDLKLLYRMPEDGNKQIFDVMWSPDFKHLSFYLYDNYPKNHENYSNVYLIDADGTNLQHLENAEFLSTKWSPDSNHLTYLRYIEWQNRYDGLFIANSDGSNISRFLDRPVVSYAWSPDSTQIAISSFGDIYILPLRNPKQLLRLAVNATEPRLVDWSPDANFVSYVVDEYLFDVRVADKKTTRLVRLPWAYDNYAWTLDGQRLTFVNYSYNGGLGIINADGTNRQALIAGRFYSMSQSPKLNKILSRGGDETTFVIDYESGSSFQLDEASDTGILYRRAGQSAVWSPDGNQIAFITKDTVCLSGADGTNKQCLESTAKVEHLLGLAWQGNVIH